MQTFKTFFRLTKSRKLEILIYFGVFVLLVTMLYKFNKPIDSTFELTTYSIAICDMDNSNASRALCEHLESQHTRVHFDTYDEETIQDNLYYERISYYLLIPDGFETSLEEGNYNELLESSKRPDSAAGYYIDQQLEGYLSTLSLYLAGDYSLDDAINATNDTIHKTTETKSISFQSDHSSQTEPFYFFLYGPYIFLQMFIVILTPILSAFRRKDLKERINCSSAPSKKRAADLALSCCLFSLIIWACFMIYGIFVVGTTNFFTLQGLLCSLNSFMFLLIVTALALVLSLFRIEKNFLHIAANVISVSLSFLSGIFVPQWLLGKPVLMFSRFTPVYWYVRVHNMTIGLSDELFSYSAYWKYLGIEFAFFLVIIGIYFMKRKRV